MNVCLTEAEIRCFKGLPYRCEFPQIKIVCQQIRGHSVRVLLTAVELAPLLYAAFTETEDPPLTGTPPWRELLLETQARWVRMATLLNNRLKALKNLEQ